MRLDVDLRRILDALKDRSKAIYEPRDLSPRCRVPPFSHRYRSPVHFTTRTVGVPSSTRTRDPRIDGLSKMVEDREPDRFRRHAELRQFWQNLGAVLVETTIVVTPTPRSRP